MSQTAAEVLAGASFESDGQEYSLLRLPALSPGFPGHSARW